VKVFGSRKILQKIVYRIGEIVYVGDLTITMKSEIEVEIFRKGGERR
jgi:hypothetical protein